MNIAVIKEKLAKMLSPERFSHSQRVSETAAIMAEKYGVSPEKAVLAGLLHDCARETAPDKLLQIAGAFAIVITDVDRLLPVLLHAPVGAFIAKKEFGVYDEEILRAISLHTVGGKSMTNLDKIIYLADFIEPGRNCQELEPLRNFVLEKEQAGQDAQLDKALLKAYDNSIKYNIDKKALLHPGTLEGRNDLLKLMKGA